MKPGTAKKKAQGTLVAQIEKKLPAKSRMALRRRRMLDVIIVGQFDDTSANVLAALLSNSKSIRILTGGFDGFERKLYLRAR